MRRARRGGGGDRHLQRLLEELTGKERRGHGERRAGGRQDTEEVASRWDRLPVAGLVNPRYRATSD